MKTRECTRQVFLSKFFFSLLAVAVLFAGCSNPEKTKLAHVQRGDAYLKEKKFQEASIEFRNAIQIDDQLAAAHWGLAQAFEGMERFAEAFEELKRSANLDASNLDAHVKLGNYFLAPAQKNSEMISQAESLAKGVLQRNANHIEGHILMGNVLYFQNRMDEALGELNRAIELDPRRVESYLSLARFYTNRRDLEKAEETYRRAQSTNQNSALAHVEYGKFLAQLGRADQAEAEFRRAVEVEPANRESRKVLASFYLVNNRNDRAEEAFKALSELDRDRPDGRAVLADFYSAVGRFDEAIKIYEELAANSPDYLRARYRLAEIMLQRGDASGATTQVAEALKKNERDMQALLLRARVRLLNGENKSAVEDLKEVLKQQPNDRAGLYFMAEANYRIGQLEQARAFAADLERFFPDYLPARLMQVQLSIATGDSKSALNTANDLIERLTRTAPSSDMPPQLLAELRLKAYTTRGQAQLRLQNPKAARIDLETAKNLLPNSPEVYVNLAIVSVAEKNLEEATKYYEQALAIDVANFDGLNGLINNVYARQNRLDLAHQRVDAAINSQSNRAPLHFLKAQVSLFENNHQRAEKELRRTMQLEPNYIGAYFALGGLYNQTGRQDQAIAEYRRAIEIGKESNNTVSNAYTLIGVIEDGRQNFDAAVESYRKALEADPQQFIAANNLAWLYAVHGKGNIDEAVRLAQGVVQRFPTEAGYADTLGWVYYKKGLHGAAVEQLQKVVRSASTIPTYRYHLGMALAGAGNKPGARRELEAALRIGEGKQFAEADEVRKALASL